MRASNRLRCWIATPVWSSSRRLTHEGEAVSKFYASIPPPVVVGIEATGSMGWFLRLMEEVAIDCRVGHPTGTRKVDAPAETRSPQCGAVAAAAGGGSLSGDLDAVRRVAGSPVLTPASPSVGPHADARAECAAASTNPSPLRRFSLFVYVGPPRP